MRRAAVLFLAIGAVFAAFSGCIQGDRESSGEQAGIILTNGKIWTADDNMLYAEAVAIKGDRIIFVGSSAKAADYTGPSTKTVDLGGRLAVPGFEDSHTHFLATAATANSSTGNPFAPSYSGYNEYQAYLTRGAIGSTHVATKLANSTPTDMPVGASSLRLPTVEQMLPGIKLGMEEALKMGLTTIFEAGTDWEYLDALNMLNQSGELKVRFELYLASRHLDEMMERGTKMGDGDNWVRVLGVKFYGDGWLGPRTCALLEPFNDTMYPWQAMWSDGILFMEQDKANADVLKAYQAGYKIATHTIGDRAIDVFLNAYENAMNEFPGRDLRPTLEHCQVLSSELIEKIKEVGAIPSIQLSFATTDMRFAEDALGAERAKWSYPWKTLLDEGIQCAGGSDFNVETLSPLWGIQRIVTRQEVDGYPEGGWHPEQRITVEQALRLITIDSAYNSFEENEKGSITPGKLADIVVLSQNILSIPPNEIMNTTVEMTMVGGAPMYVSPDSGIAGAFN
ncbi:MAG: amidohydrolase [Candidatus Thermoplasmatota archaeon]|nr:amidohydrolase [Candidatus Thermoplasmatota archaeon]